jgi:hypothetical protein
VNFTVARRAIRFAEQSNENIFTIKIEKINTPHNTPGINADECGKREYRIYSLIKLEADQMPRLLLNCSERRLNELGTDRQLDGFRGAPAVQESEQTV